MPIAAPNGNGFANLTATFAAVSAKRAAATVKTLCSQVMFTAGDPVGVYHLGQIPSKAIIDPRSVALVAAIAGLTSVSVGISGAGGQAVAPGVPNCLVSATTWAAGGSLSLTGAITAANGQKEAWQLAGLASDPGGVLEVYLTTGAGPTATGVATTFLSYLVD